MAANKITSSVYRIFGGLAFGLTATLSVFCLSLLLASHVWHFEYVHGRDSNVPGILARLLGDDPKALPHIGGWVIARGLLISEVVVRPSEPARSIYALGPELRVLRRSQLPVPTQSRLWPRVYRDWAFPGSGLSVPLLLPAMLFGCLAAVTWLVFDVRRTLSAMRAAIVRAVLIERARTSLRALGNLVPRVLYPDERLRIRWRRARSPGWQRLLISVLVPVCFVARISAVLIFAGLMPPLLLSRSIEYLLVLENSSDRSLVVFCVATAAWLCVVLLGFFHKEKEWARQATQPRGAGNAEGLS